jgi:hypothetical protein
MKLNYFAIKGFEELLVTIAKHQNQELRVFLNEKTGDNVGFK